MIIYIDFASVGDARFYRLEWEKAIKDSKKPYYLIYSDIEFSLNRSFLSLPHNFVSNNIINNVIKFISQSLIIFFTTAWITFSKKNKVLIFSLHQPFIYWNWLKYIKSRKLNVIGVIHDILEFDTYDYPAIIISSNKKIIRNLDAVILHSGELLFKNVYNYKKKIYILPFPYRKPYEYQQAILNFEYFLIPGRYRKEKGFDFVIKNWPKNFTTIPLVVMTKVPLELEEIIALNENILYHPNLNSEESFVNLILHCTAAILMYTSGTNSGILETLIANQKKVITSKISIFTNHNEQENFIFCEKNPIEFQKSIYNFNLSNKSQSYPSRNEDNSSECYKNFLNQIF